MRRRYGALKRRELKPGVLSKYYYVAVYDRATRRTSWHTTGCKAKRAAEEWVEARQKAELLGMDPEQVVPEVPFSSAVAKWLRAKEGTVDSKHFRNLSYQADVFWKAYFGDRALAELTSDDVRDYLRRRQLGTIPGIAVGKNAKRRKGRRSATTVNNDRGALRAFFAFCVDEGLLLRSPADRVKPTSQTMKRRARTLGPDEWEALLRACREEYKVPAKGKRNVGGVEGGATTSGKSKWTQTSKPPAHLYPIVVIALYCAFRKRTILSLDWAHIDLKNRVWRIPAESVKTKWDIRTPIPKTVVKALLEYCPKPPKRGSVFGMNPRSSSISRSFSAACKRAGIEGFTFHSCRGAFLNRLRSLGVDLDTVMSLTAHMDVNTVMRHYREVPVEAQLDALDKLDDA